MMTVVPVKKRVYKKKPGPKKAGPKKGKKKVVTVTRVVRPTRVVRAEGWLGDLWNKGVNIVKGLHGKTVVSDNLARAGHLATHFGATNVGGLLKSGSSFAARNGFGKRACGLKKLNMGLLR